MPKWLQWLGFLVSGLPPDDLRSSTVHFWTRIMVAICVVATLFVIVALALGVRPG